MVATHTQKAVDAIINRQNPLIIFEDTYDVHQELVSIGVLIEGRLPGSLIESRYPNKTFEYRVDHGRGYITLNTWYEWSVVPHIEDLPHEKVA